MGQVFNFHRKAVPDLVQEGKEEDDVWSVMKATKKLKLPKVRTHAKKVCPMLFNHYPLRAIGKLHNNVGGLTDIVLSRRGMEWQCRFDCEGWWSAANDTIKVY